MSRRIGPAFTESSYRGGTGAFRLHWVVAICPGRFTVGGSGIAVRISHKEEPLLDRGSFLPMGEFMWRHRLQQSFFIAFVLGAIVFALWWDERQVSQPPQKRAQKRAGYEWIEDAKFHPHSNNDGDSFLMDHAGQAHEFRLYFVDCPEKRLHQYNGSRIDQQGKYFGGLGRQDMIEIGLEAKAFTEELLATKRFTLQTRWQKVFDSGRFYAFILFEDGEYLSEKLVREGLCRIYTEGAPLPDGRRERDFEAHLKKLEKQAKETHQGAWSR